MRLPNPGLAVRVALILFAAVLLVQAALVVLWFDDQRRATRDLFERAGMRRIVAATRLLDGSEEDRYRFGLLAAINSPTLHLRLAAEPPPVTRFGPDHVRRTIGDRLQRVLDGREVRVGFRWHRRGPPRHRWRDRADRDRGRHRWFDGGPPDGPPGDGPPFRMRHGLPDCDPAKQDDCPDIDTGPPILSGGMMATISVALADGTWAVFTASLPDPERRWLWRLIGWNLLATAVAAVFAYFAARRLTRPLAEFTAAADRLGRDLGAPPVHESGAPEMRRAAAAFNVMQGRLQRFVADRTLMIAAISHDLRTMLTRLRLRVEYVADAEQRTKALADLDDMTAMLNATLAFARDDAADEPAEKVDLASLLRSLCDDLADAGNPVAFDGPDTAVLSLRPRAVRRAVANLIDNALKYGGRADVGLTVEAARMVVAVGDRGPGIPQDRREEVFRPFFRLEGSRSRETGGSGLGLAVVRNIVHRHGGDIQLRDRDGGGLEVVVTLPR